MDHNLHRLQQPDVLVSPRQVLAQPSAAPEAPGVYAWYFDLSPSPAIDLNACWLWQGRHLLYVGIAPSRPPETSKPPSRSNLRRRLKQHMNGNASASTLRLTLGCLLAGSLGIELRRVGSSGRMKFSTGEQVLSAWIRDHARVTWIVHPEPWLVEEAAIEHLYMPLNLDQNSVHPFHATLSAARSRAKARARALPILPK